MCTRFFFFQAEDGIRYLVRSRGLGDVYKRQLDKLFKQNRDWVAAVRREDPQFFAQLAEQQNPEYPVSYTHLTLPTSDLV